MPEPLYAESVIYVEAFQSQLGPLYWKGIQIDRQSGRQGREASSSNSGWVEERRRITPLTGRMMGVALLLLFSPQMVGRLGISLLVIPIVFLCTIKSLLTDEFSRYVRCSRTGLSFPPPPQVELPWPNRDLNPSLLRPCLTPNLLQHTSSQYLDQASQNGTNM